MSPRKKRQNIVLCREKPVRLEEIDGESLAVMQIMEGWHVALPLSQVMALSGAFLNQQPSEPTPEAPDVCVWTPFDAHGEYFNTCGEERYVAEGEDPFKFCPECGKPVQVADLEGSNAS